MAATAAMINAGMVKQWREYIYAIFAVFLSYLWEHADENEHT